MTHDNLSDDFWFTSDSIKEFESLLKLYFEFLKEGKCCQEILTLLKGKMTEMIGRLVNEGKVIAAISMFHDRDLLTCLRHKKCPILKFMSECFSALITFPSQTYTRMPLSYVA